MGTANAYAHSSTAVAHALAPITPAAQLDVILAMPGVTKPTVNQLPYSLAYHPKNILEYNTERGACSERRRAAALYHRAPCAATQRSHARRHEPPPMSPPRLRPLLTTSRF